MLIPVMLIPVMLIPGMLIPVMLMLQSFHGLNLHSLSCDQCYICCWCIRVNILTSPVIYFCSSPFRQAQAVRGTADATVVLSGEQEERDDPAPDTAQHHVRIAPRPERISQPLTSYPFSFVASFCYQICFLLDQLLGDCRHVDM